MKYKEYQRNHVILPGREAALASFLRQDYKGMKHKLRNAINSHSEDALTWSCFDALANLPSLDKATALDEILEDSFDGRSPFSFCTKGISNGDINICIGKQYMGASTNEATEVDVSVEAPGVLVFFEAKLYSAVSLATENRHDQIARKLRVGLDSIVDGEQAFFFILLDLAPVEMMLRKPNHTVDTGLGTGYKDKWRSAWLFQSYKVGQDRNLRPLEDALEGVAHRPVAEVAARMGWLTWADLFKCTLRATLRARS